MKGKRGMMVTGIVEVMLYIGTAVMIIVLFFVLNYSRNSRNFDIGQQTVNADLGFMLTNFLREPYEHNGEQISIAEAIAVYEYGDEKDRSIKDEIERLFDEKFDSLEHCKKDVAVTVTGYMIMIMDEQSYNDGVGWVNKKSSKEKNIVSNYVSGSLIKDEKKFRSKNFIESIIIWESIFFSTVPGIAEKNVYLGIFASRINSGGGDLSEAAGCG